MPLSLRRAPWALLALAPFAYLACGDDTADTTTTPDASTASDAASSTSDAASTATPDAEATDAGADADAATTAVKVTAFTESTHAPAPGATVLFYAPDGGVASTATTDANGQASAELPTGGQVTAVFGTASAPRIVTVQAVQPGDALTVVYNDVPLSKYVQFVVTAPATPFPSTASTLVAYGTCTSPLLNGTSTYGFGPYCLFAGSTGTVSLLALDAQKKVLAVSSVENVELPAGGTKAVTFDAWTAAAADVTVEGTHLPTVLADGVTSSGTVLSHAEGKGSGTIGGKSVLGGVPASRSTTFSPILVGATFAQNEVLFYEETESPFAMISRAIATRGAAGTGHSFDFTAPLPRITATTLTGTDAPTVGFTSEQPLTATKGLVAKVRWNIPESNLGGSWLIVAPPTTTTFTAPALPAGLADHGPAGHSFQTPAFVGAFDGTMLADYAAARAAGAIVAPGQNLELGGFAPVSPVLPVDGTLKLTAYGQNGD